MILSELNTSLSACKTPAEIEAVMREYRNKSGRQRESLDWSKFLVTCTEKRGKDLRNHNKRLPNA